MEYKEQRLQKSSVNKARAGKTVTCSQALSTTYIGLC